MTLHEEDSHVERLESARHIHDTDIHEIYKASSI